MKKKNNQSKDLKWRVRKVVNFVHHSKYLKYNRDKINDFCKLITAFKEKPKRLKNNSFEHTSIKKFDYI